MLDKQDGSDKQDWSNAYFFDRHRFLVGLLVMLDPILDVLPFRFLTTTNLGMLCQKPLQERDSR